MGYLLVAIRSVSTGVTTIFCKNYMTNTRDIKLGLDILMLISYPIALVFYFCMAGFSVPANLPTLLYAFVYAFIAIMSNNLSLNGYNYATIVYLNVFGAAGGTIMLFLYELIFTDVVFTFLGILSVIFRVLAVSIPLLYNKSERTMTKTGFLICCAYFIVLGVAEIVNRMYVNNPNVMSTASFGFWTNVFIIPIVFGNIFRKSSVKALASDAKRVGVKNFLYVVGNATLGNLMMIVSFEVIRFLGGTRASVLYGSLSMAVTAFVSVVIYKESITRQSVISVVLSVAAVVLSVF